VKADKVKALDMFTRERWILGPRLYLFCTNASDGKFVALNGHHARQLLGQESERLRIPT